MIKISDRITLMMLLDNVHEWPIERLTFKSLQISTNVKFHLPSAHFVFADKEGVLKKFPLGDGQSIRIILKVANSSTPAYDIKMRVFKLSKKPSGNIDYYDLFMNYDAPRYLLENSRGSFNASSADALEKISSACGLTMQFALGAVLSNGQVVPKTNTTDKQVWIPHGMKYCNFAQDIVKAAYSGTNSCMKIGVDFAGNLIYRDLSIPWYGNNRSIPYLFSTIQKSDTIRILAKKDFTDSGLMNAFGGYRMTTVEQNPLKGKSSTQTQHSKVAVTTKTDSVAVNKNITNALSGSHVVFAPLNCGNTHDNYELALHQNSRLAGMYSVGMYLATDDINPSVSLLQTVKLDTPEITNGDREYNKVSAGEWEIGGKTIFISAGGKYFEKYEVRRPGQNNMANNTTQSGTAA